MHNAFLYPETTEEKYSRSFIVSISIHVLVFLLVIFGQYFIPRKVISIGTGIGGGTGSDISTIGVIDEFSGGAGMVKPSIIPKPPILKEKLEEDKSKAIPLPNTVEPRKKTISQRQKTPESPTAANIIPTTPEPGSGGTGGYSSGSGGGIGGGIGVSLGDGSGSFGDNAYFRTIEKRISSNWSHPPDNARINIIYSFYIDAYGRILGIQKEKSSGNPMLDYMAERAILSCKDPPLPKPPQEFRGRTIQLKAYFIYPQDP
jgi:outer membrane biosynthesis protein TonB